MTDALWISAADALKRLGVKPQTLYAYVSRGELRAKPDPEDSRKSLYARHDVQALAARKRRPRRRAEVAQSAISWGEPVLESGISTVRDGRLWFGDMRADELAETATLEDASRQHWRAPHLDISASQASVPGVDAKSRGYRFLASLAASTPSSVGRAPTALASEAANILPRFADAMIGQSIPGPIHQRLATHWNLSGDRAQMIRAALVLLSDHELNASTFAVRVAASTGAPLAAAVLAGYATLNGPLHGEAAIGALQFLRQATASRHLNDAISQHAGASSYKIGFGHPLYPDGDPRAAVLLNALSGTPVHAAIDQSAQVIGRAPNIDIALAALTLGLELPDDAPFVLFAIGRMSGWLAHAMEQVEHGDLIRPRARFVVRD